MNVERGTAINGRCYARAAAWANADAAFVPDTCINGTTQPDARIYTQFDANYNVTALIGYNASTNTWGVVQRYVYTPYGVATVLDANWNPTTDQFTWQYMHQGGRLDPITGLYDFRNRDYSPTLGNWIEQDPMGYINGASRYQFVGSAPAAWHDPSGTVRGRRPNAGASARDQLRGIKAAQRRLVKGTPSTREVGGDWQGARSRPKQAGINRDKKSEDNALREAGQEAAAKTDEINAENARRAREAAEAAAGIGATCPKPTGIPNVVDLPIQRPSPPSTAPSTPTPVAQPGEPSPSLGDWLDDIGNFFGQLPGDIEQIPAF